MRHLCKQCGAVELVAIDGPDARGRSLYACPGCKTPHGWKLPQPPMTTPLSVPIPPFGPGTELHKLLNQLGFNIGGCSCQWWLDNMNRWGIDGCIEHRAEIVAHLESQKDAASPGEKLKAGALALANGLPLTIGGLVDEAIRFAAQSE